MTSPMLDISIVGSPDWWLRQMSYALLDRQVEYEVRRRYSEGDADLPNADRRYMKALKGLQEKAMTNYCGLIETAPLERMRVRGFRFGPIGTADDDAKKVWNANDMDLQANIIHAYAARFGVGYACVSPPGPKDKFPVITAEDPRTTFVYRDPARPTRVLAGLKMWLDDLEDKIMAVVYLPEGTYAYVGPSGEQINRLDHPQLKRMLFGAQGFMRLESFPNPTGVVGIVEYVWRPGSSDWIPYGEVGTDIQIIQDRINQTILDRLVISRSQAYRQRWMSGATIPKTKKGQRRAPFDPGADMLWVSASPDAKFGDFAAADIRQILEAVRDDVADIAAISKTPPHYLMGKMANVSGETLTQAETGLVSKTRQRIASMSWSHETTMKICFLHMGLTSKAEETEAEALWENPQQYTLAELADAGMKWTQTGVPLELVMERQNWTPDQIAFAKVEFDKVQEQERLLASNRAMRVQDTNAAAPAAATADTGPVATTPKPKTTTPGG